MIHSKNGLKIRQKWRDPVEDHTTFNEISHLPPDAIAFALALREDSKKNLQRKSLEDALDADDDFSVGSLTIGDSSMVTSDSVETSSGSTTLGLRRKKSCKNPYCKVLEGWLISNRAERKNLIQNNEKTQRVLDDFQEIYDEQAKRLDESEDEYRHLNSKLKELQKYEKTLLGMQQRIHATKRKYEMEIAQMKQMLAARKARQSTSSSAMGQSSPNHIASRPESQLNSSFSIPLKVTDSNHKPSVNSLSYEVALDGFRRPVKHTHTGYIQYHPDVGKHFWSCCQLEADINVLPKSVTSNIQIKPVAPITTPQSNLILKTSPVKAPRRYSQYSKQ